VEELREGGLLLGVMKSAVFTPGQARLGKGDAVVLFTDGVTEALGPDNEEFMEDRLVAVLQATVGTGAAERLRAVQDAVSAFTGPVAEASDDLTLVVLRSIE
jgi:phosphoserine phosphatase RsbU/P